MKANRQIVWVLSAAAWAAVAGAASGRPPNIIYILADDMGYGDVGALNPESRIPTPNLDRLVRDGVHFTDAHSNSSVCTPTRYGVLTGRYAFRTRLKDGVLWGYSPPLIEPARTTVASFLKTSGYHTACIGKWHLGLEWARKDPSREVPDVADLDGTFKAGPDYDDNVDYAKPVWGGPNALGFDYSLIIPASLDMMPYCYLENDVTVEAPTSFTEGRDQALAGRGVFWRAGPVSPSFDFDQVLPFFVESSCRYIRERARESDPFFLYLALPAPHTPWLPLAQHKGRSGAGTYGDFVVMIDDLMGDLMKTLDDLNLGGSTLLIFTSDNGADWRDSDNKEHGHRANHIFKGRKADIYEAGHRIPFIARWSGTIPPGRHSDQLMCTTDLLATLAGLLNQELPAGSGEDSVNLWPAFVGQVDAPLRESVIHHSLHGFYSIRRGKWKFTPHLGSGGFTDPKTSEPVPGDPPGTLFDMDNDPGETRNLYARHPEIVVELSHLLEKLKYASRR